MSHGTPLSLQRASAIAVGLSWRAIAGHEVATHADPCRRWGSDKPRVATQDDESKGMQ